MFRLLLAMAAGIALSVASTASAQRADKANQFYDDALRRFEKNDVGGAIVQLKNALQQDPKMLAGYVLLGKAELARGDAAAAEDAFTKASELGVDRSEIAVLMAQALHDQGKYQVLLERFPPDGLPAARKLELLVLRGHAYKGLRDLKSAARSFEDARALDPKFVPALLSLAELLAQEGKRKDALKLADEAIQLAPNDPRLWNLKGSLALAAGDAEAALAAFGRALSISPAYTDARIANTSLLLDLNRLSEVEPHIPYLAKERADPRAAYIRAVYRSKRGDNAGTRDTLNEVTRLIDPVPRGVLRARAPETLLLGGLAHYGLNQPEKARSYLEEYLEVDRDHVGARKLLGSVLLSQGDPRGALSALEPGLKVSPSDPELLALLATAYMGRKQYQKATDYLERALKASGGAPELQTTLGLGLLGAGNQDLGLEHLQRAFSKDPGQPRAGIALGVLYLRQRQYDRAVKVAEAIVQREPDNVVALNLLGVARAAMGDRKGARSAYDRAIAGGKSMLSPQVNLARLDLAEGNPDAARMRLQAILKDRPKSTLAMVELAAVEEHAGRRDEAIRWLEKARAVERRDVQVTASLVDLYILAKLPEKALEVAKDAEVSAPDNLVSLAALGRAYLALGNEKAAQTIFSRMTRLAAFDAGWLTEIARYQIAANDPKSAAFSLEKALMSKPDWPPAQQLLVELDVRSGELPKAEQRAKAMVARNPTQPIGYRLMADIAMARKNYPEAIQGYRSALGRDETSEGALRLFQAYVYAGNPEQANGYLESWIKQHPDDLVAMRALAEGYLRAGNLAAARAWYEQVLKRQGDDASVLNNLAIILARQGDAKALEYAERAYQLAPKQGVIQDTLGWVLVQRGDVDKGLRHLREARLREPQNPEIRYHLAVALARVGRRDEARAELEEVLKGTPAFDGAKEARVLLGELSAR